MIVRVSIGHFEGGALEQVEQLLREGGDRLIPAIRGLRGCRHYYVGIDRSRNAIVNVSVWETLQDAMQMASLRAMQQEGERMRAIGVRFEPITNHETVWTIPE